MMIQSDASFPKTLKEGYNSSIIPMRRPLLGRLKQCAICGVAIYVRRYRLKEKNYCSKCNGGKIGKYSKEHKGNKLQRWACKLKPGDSKSVCLECRRQGCVEK